ncbi:Serine/threonine-protein kinase PknH [Gemmata sp. SH-PL17]|uniref:serine/threonine-protein kinase n=1 Tax=Gemmata sp. SH-PL17 TaxID=1630693 RepID=UPI00078D8C04|nr:serine/threonine-protein kinase [Gemmata sp. SH-PL17]AMV24045.1 Serine/threonine-protein kinase PknH [Gemmata sp. SH-PL17]
MTPLLSTTGTAAERALATELKRRWRRGESPDAAAALAEHPELTRHKSLVVDLAYEEYLLREKAGAAPEISAFAGQFPVFGGSVRKVLDAHQLLTEHPELLDPAAAAWPEPGTQFEGLELHVELGRGAFGRAYLAFDPGTDRLCVLKLTTGRSAEARVIGRLAHPNVTDIYWTRPVGLRTALCMPFVGVSTLADVNSAVFSRPGGQPPDEARVILEAAEADGLAGYADRLSQPVVRPDEPYLVGACAVAAKIAHAVAYLNNHGVIHGDLKPSNIVVGPGGTPHLIDFNLSTAEAPRMVRGTPAYMAPELLSAARAGGTAAGIDAVRADLFSLGLVVTELLTGRLPFELTGSREGAQLEGVVERGAAQLPPALPAVVASVLASCLATDPEQRPASAAPVAVALDRFVARWRSRRLRQRGTVAALASLALLCGVAAALARTWPSSPSRELMASEPLPRSANDFLERGRNSLRSGNVAAARTDFAAAYDRSGDPRALALVAYGMALDGQAAPSIEAGKQAIQEGAASAEVYNNLGYALSQSARPADAVPPLNEAILRAPQLRAAYYNRALARYRAALAAQTVDLHAAEDIATALSLGEPSLNLHFDAARIYAACSVKAPEFRIAALEQIRAAISAGKDPVACRTDALLATHLKIDPGFEAALATPRGEPPGRVPQLRLVEPLS